MSWMDVRGQIEVLRREIAEIQQAELTYLAISRRDYTAKGDHERREQRLKEIMNELNNLSVRMKP
jgi:hypothetical protein